MLALTRLIYTHLVSLVCLLRWLASCIVLTWSSASNSSNTFPLLVYLLSLTLLMLLLIHLLLCRSLVFYYSRLTHLVNVVVWYYILLFHYLNCLVLMLWPIVLSLLTYSTSPKLSKTSVEPESFNNLVVWSNLPLLNLMLSAKLV